ncbi:dynein light chain roadblock-type 2 [Eurytemora carolleeae]|uniref:dynein light chain roadblock-type 2 n=1 Tax=Eurytemora carolleeae TaxID=1294199 RepID=UPI000C7864FE|nr:dynein light chain roadblock-type 2 [Eurytemora carolleeae]|eukprot:XP_023326930.1 dynein light chain roadblock-type 2-like [Eurytemora affinis]
MGEPERAGTVSITTQVDQILKRIGANSKVEGVVVINNEGIPIKSTLDSTSTVQYSAEISQLAERAKCLVRDLDPTNHLTFVRIASKKHEVLVAPDTDYIMIVLQKTKKSSSDE